MVNENGDTSICFTIEQSKYLLKQCYVAKEYIELDSLCEQTSNYKDSVIIADEKIIVQTKLLVKDKESIIAIQKDEIGSLKDSLEISNDEIQEQKFKKCIWMFSTAIVSAVFGYYIISH